METTTNNNDMLIMSYHVPFVEDDYRINVYLYDSSSYEPLVFQYYDDIPSIYLAAEPSLKDTDHLQFESGDEFVIMINKDRLSESERLAALVEDLYIVADTIADVVDSEEFGARVIGDVFKKTAPLLYPGLALSEKSSRFGLAIDDYPIPLVSDTYHVTLNVYNHDIKDDVVSKLREKFWRKMIKGEFKPLHYYGFMVEPEKDELAVFVNISDIETLLMQETILVHELFHASRKLAKIFEDESAILGSYICRTLFKQFASCLTEGPASEDDSNE